LQIEASRTWSIMLASGAILATGVTKSDPSPYIFLSPLVLIIPGMLGEAVQSSGVWRIGSYISVFHETHGSGLAWETRNWRFVGGKKPVGHASPYLRFLSTSMFAGLGVICFILALQTGKLPWYAFLLTLAAAIAGFGYATRKMVSVRADFEQCLRRWKQIKAEEEANPH